MMIHAETIFTIARDNNGPEFYTGVVDVAEGCNQSIHSAAWVHTPILARFYYAREFAEDELKAAKAHNYIGIERAFIQEVRVITELVFSE